jgi:sucrose-6F-phosphate phosphohydrolase
MKKLLASDLDGTLIPLSDEPYLHESVKTFSDYFIKQKSLLLAYVTGRHFELACAGIRDFELPHPDYLVCDVGTSIYRKKNSNEWISDSEYMSHLSSRWELDHADQLVSILQHIQGISLQESFRQSSLKLSYYTPADSAEDILKEIKHSLHSQNISARIIYSRDEIKGLGLIDILPPDTAKHSALDYLSDTLGFNKENILYAGDSGNDLAVIHAGYPSILVGNTPDDVKMKAKEYALNSPEFLYCAREHSAAGVIEGCKYFEVFS